MGCVMCMVYNKYSIHVQFVICEFQILRGCSNVGLTNKLFDDITCAQSFCHY